MYDRHAAAELARMRHQEMVERADRHRLVKEARVAARRNMQPSNKLSIGRLVALYRSIRASLRSRQGAGLDRPTSLPAAASNDSLTARDINLDTDEDLEIRIETAPAHTDLSPTTGVPKSEASHTDAL